MPTLSDSLIELIDQKRRLVSLCVAYGNARSSAFIQRGLAQEVSLENGAFVPCARPLPDNALYDLASLTKLFTGVALFQLVDSGRLRLDERIGAVEPRFARLRDTTVYDVCCYRAYLHTDERIDAAPSREEALRRLFTLHRVPLPDQRIYSDLNALALGLVIEARTGRSLYDVFTDAILRPAGMRETFARLPEALLPRAVCYNYEHRITGDRYTPVSYTHLDVYKRQILHRFFPSPIAFRLLS